MYAGYLLSHLGFLAMNGRRRGTWCTVRLLRLAGPPVASRGAVTGARDARYRDYQASVRYRIIPGIFLINGRASNGSSPYQTRSETRGDLRAMTRIPTNGRSADGFDNSIGDTPTAEERFLRHKKELHQQLITRWTWRPSARWTSRSSAWRSRAPPSS